MNSPSYPRLARRRPPRVAATVTVLAATALLTAACGGSPSAAGSGASPSTGSPASASGSRLLAYSQCMRSHGVPSFPDPDGSGQISKQAIIAAANSAGTSVFQSAGNACAHLAPSGLGPSPASITAQDQQDYLRAAACMRSRGITGFPDPVFSSGSVSFPTPPAGFPTSSPRFIQARQTCERLIPAGLPYSGSE